MNGSGDLYDRAQRVSPGGVHSPVRAFAHVGGDPIFMQAARGATLIDVDGREYLDFCMGFGPLILGHRDSQVQAAVRAAVDHGWSSGTAEQGSLELAELICRELPWMERIRFVNSGTEAVMSAIRLARAATCRDGVLKFSGCYHGHTDAVLIEAGSGLAGRGRPSSAGIPDGVTQDTYVAQLDDIEGLEALFREHGNQLSAAIIEPVPANHGLLPQTTEFLETLARLCREYGALLIFDEVITGFRLGFGGFAGQSGIRPDLVTYGKIIGGGFPVGAFGGRAEIMEQVAPLGDVYQAGTLSANPVAMCAGLATLKRLRSDDSYALLDKLAARLRSALTGIQDVFLQQAGSIFWLGIGEPARDPMRAPADCPRGLNAGYAGLFAEALKNGIYLPPSPYEVGFLSLAHGTADVARLSDLVTEFSAHG